MNELTFYRQAIHDTSLMCLLAVHYECLIRGDIDINGRGTPELAKATRTVTAALEHLKTLMQEQAAAEHPDKDFDSFTLENYDGCWPPRITSEGEA